MRPPGGLGVSIKARRPGGALQPRGADFAFALRGDRRFGRLEARRDYSLGLIRRAGHHAARDPRAPDPKLRRALFGFRALAFHSPPWRLKKDRAPRSGGARTFCGGGDDEGHGDKVDRAAREDKWRSDIMGVSGVVDLLEVIARPPKNSIAIVIQAIRWGAGTPSACKIIANDSGPLARLANPCSMKPYPTIKRSGSGAQRA
jgi:hypothetical protein